MPGGLQSALLQASTAAVMHNAQVKRYPDGGCKVLVADRPIFRARGFEAAGERRAAEAEALAEADAAAGPGAAGRAASTDRQGDAESEARDGAPGDGAAEVAARRAEESAERSKRRARSAVYDLARSTEFRYFVTLTCSPEKVDRLDDAAVFAKLHNWLDNEVRRKGLAYVVVPEYHKAGGLHFHGFFNGALPALDSGTISLPGVKRPRRPRSEAERRRWLADGGHVVYNLPDWSLGFSTAIELYGARSAAVGYVCKYITKAERKIGGRWYYSGGKLQRPEVFCADLDFDDAFARTGGGFAVDALGAICCSYEEGAENEEG